MKLTPKTHCTQGHPFDEANTGTRPSDGSRYCRTCGRERMRRSKVGLPSVARYERNAVVGAESFWRRVIKPANGSGCWLWTGPQDENGYGRASRPRVLGKGTAGAHRVAWFYTHGSLPPAPLQLDHLCHVVHCVNPSHLEVVTLQENCRRRLPRRRAVAA